ncbi:MAG TPA: SulP family inorganic anion transporter [Rhizomicrobium sp.]|nr:SulP family inorganic anion transporter [Rhizomicrobium sp.]
MPLLFRSFAHWRPTDLRGDLIAGATLAAIAVPEQMATAGLAGFSPAFGFYAFIVGSVAFAVFGAGRFVSVGADSTIAPIFAGALAAVAATGSPSYVELAATLALMVGAALVAAGIFRLGWVSNLLSVPVTTGFLAGIAVHIAVSQIPLLLGTAAGQGTLLERIAGIAASAGHANVFDVSLGLGVLAIALVCEKTSAQIPGALIGLVLATLIVVLLHLEHRGVATIGPIALASPHFGLAAVAPAALSRLAALAFIVSLIVMMQTAATLEAFAGSNDPPDINRDFIGVGVGSIVSGLIGGFALNASPPRTALVKESGGRSQLSGLLAAAILGALLVAGPGLFAHVPKAALGGVLLFVALRITRVSNMVEVFRQAFAEFLLIVATIAAIVILPIELGVGVGIFLSLAHGVWTTTRAGVIALERVPGTSIWWPPTSASSGETIDGILVLAFQAPLSFLNANDFRREFLTQLERAAKPLTAVILEASNVIEIDFTGAEVLRHLVMTCGASGIPLYIARLESLRAQAALRRFGILQLLGENHSFLSVQDAVDAVLSEPRPR